MPKGPEAIRRQRLAQAAIVAGSAFAFSLALKAVSAVLYVSSSVMESQSYQLNFLEAFVGARLLVVSLVFFAGVFLWFWLLAPPIAQLPLGGVIGHSLIAVGVGAVVSGAVSIGFGLQSWFANAQFFSNSFGQAAESFSSDWPNAFTMALSSSVSVAFDVLPAVVLAAVLVWVWSTRRRVSVRAAASVSDV